MTLLDSFCLTFVSLAFITIKHGATAVELCAPPGLGDDTNVCRMPLPNLPEAYARPLLSGQDAKTTDRVPHPCLKKTAKAEKPVLENGIENFLKTLNKKQSCADFKRARSVKDQGGHLTNGASVCVQKYKGVADDYFSFAAEQCAIIPDCNQYKIGANHDCNHMAGVDRPESCQLGIKMVTDAKTGLKVPETLAKDPCEGFKFVFCGYGHVCQIPKFTTHFVFCCNDRKAKVTRDLMLPYLQEVYPKTFTKARKLHGDKCKAKDVTSCHSYFGKTKLCKCNPATGICEREAKWAKPLVPPESKEAVVTLTGIPCTLPDVELGLAMGAPVKSDANMEDANMYNDNEVVVSGLAAAAAAAEKTARKVFEDGFNAGFDAQLALREVGGRRRERRRGAADKQRKRMY